MPQSTYTQRGKRGSISVGTSRRTPSKHALLDGYLGQEAGATRYLPAVKSLAWFDLCAGDGIAQHTPWHRNCSPGILAWHGSQSWKPTAINLYEIRPRTFGRLEASLAEHLPNLPPPPSRASAYQRQDGVWIRDHATIHTHHLDGAKADLDGVDADTAVLVVNDPNAITTWAMRPTFVEEIRERTPWFRGISTMGCNVGGLKRLDRDEREQWYDLVQQKVAGLYRYHDLLLVAIEKDSDQWAYLIEDSSRADWKAKTEKLVKRSFDDCGLATRAAWLCEDRVGFRGLQDDLFLTRKERGR
jgi:hypothetical protein